MFSDSLETALTIDIEGKVFKISSGSISFFECDLYQYGYFCKVSFWVSAENKEDKLYPLFIKDNVIDVTMAVSAHFIPKNMKKLPLTLSGIVKEKSILQEVVIENVHLKKNPVLYRQYQLLFADPAQVLWSQHFPCDLTVNTKVKSLFEKNSSPKIKIKYEWSELDKKFPINTLPLCSPENRASFYDFLIWLVKVYNGVFTYNYTENQYCLSDEKPKADKPFALSKQDISSYSVFFPEVSRSDVNLLNSYSEKPETKVIKESESKLGIRKDILMRTSISSEMEDKAAMEKARLKRNRTHELEVIFARFPVVSLLPGTALKFSGELWSSEQFLNLSVYRMRHLHIKATAANQEADANQNMSYNKYNIQLEAELEPEKDTYVSLPDFESPHFPVLLEGYVVSEAGDEKDETYQIYQDPNTSLDRYKIAIPLFDNVQVIAPYEPIFFTGHFYFPAYKSERVLVALYLHDATIERFLDWREGVKLPVDTQGDNLLLGKNNKSQTAITHMYIDDKPQLQVKRISDSDTEILKMDEGTIVLETKDEDG